MNDNTWIHLQQIIDSRCSDRINLAMQHMLTKTDNMNIQHTELTVVPVKIFIRNLQSYAPDLYLIFWRI